MVSASVTSLVLENLINCTIVACTWGTTLCAFYQQKMKENIYMVQNKLDFKYKMNMVDTINTHVNKVVRMG